MIRESAGNPSETVPVREAAPGSRLSVASAEIRMLSIQEIRQTRMTKPSGAASLMRKDTEDRMPPGFQIAEKEIDHPAPGNAMRNPERPAKRDPLIAHPVNILIEAANLLKIDRTVLMLRGFQKTPMRENRSVPESATRNPELPVNGDPLIAHPAIILTKTGNLTKAGMKILTPRGLIKSGWKRGAGNRSAPVNVLLTAGKLPQGITPGKGMTVSLSRKESLATGIQDQSGLHLKNVKVTKLHQNPEDSAGIKQPHRISTSEENAALARMVPYGSISILPMPASAPAGKPIP